MSKAQKPDSPSPLSVSPGMSASDTGAFGASMPQISGMIYRYCVSVAGVTAQHI